MQKEKAQKQNGHHVAVSSSQGLHSNKNASDRNINSENNDCTNDEDQNTETVTKTLERSVRETKPTKKHPSALNAHTEDKPSKLQRLGSEVVRSKHSAFESSKSGSGTAVSSESNPVAEDEDFQPSAFQRRASVVNSSQLTALRASILKSGMNLSGMVSEQQKSMSSRGADSISGLQQRQTSQSLVTTSSLGLIGSEQQQKTSQSTGTTSSLVELPGSDSQQQQQQQQQQVTKSQSATSSSLIGMLESTPWHTAGKSDVARVLKFNEQSQFKPVEQGRQQVPSSLYLAKQLSQKKSSELSQSQEKAKKYPLLMDQLMNSDKADARPLKEKFHLLSNLLSQQDNHESSSNQSNQSQTRQEWLAVQLKQQEQERSSLSALDLAMIEIDPSWQPMLDLIDSAPSSPTEMEEHFKQGTLLETLQKAPLNEGPSQMQEGVPSQNVAGEIDENAQELASFRAQSAPTVQGLQRSVPASPVEMCEQPTQEFPRSLDPSPIDFPDNEDGKIPGNAGVISNPAQWHIPEKFDNFAVPAPPTPSMGIYTKDHHEGIVTSPGGSPISSPVASPIAQRSLSSTSSSHKHYSPGKITSHKPVASKPASVSDSPYQRNLRPIYPKTVQGSQGSFGKLLNHEGHLLPVNVPTQQGVTVSPTAGTVTGAQGQIQGQVGVHTGLPQTLPTVQRNPPVNPSSSNQSESTPSSSTGVNWQWHVVEPSHNRPKPKNMNRGAPLQGHRVALDALLVKSQADQNQPISLQRSRSLEQQQPISLQRSGSQQQQQPMSLQRNVSQNSGNQWQSSNPGQDML